MISTVVAHRLQLARGGFQRPHDAVDLRFPGIRHQHDSHEISLIQTASGWGQRSSLSSHSYELAQLLVVIAGNVDDACALAGVAQQLLDDIVVRLRLSSGGRNWRSSKPRADDSVVTGGWCRGRGFAIRGFADSRFQRCGRCRLTR